MIIFRYLIKEITAVFVVITAILLFIFLSNQLVRYLGYAAEGRLIGTILTHLLLLEIPNLISLLLPLGLFLGVLLAYGRLYVDNEMTVLSACGMSQTRLTVITVCCGIVVAVLVGTLTLWIVPKMYAQREQLITQVKDSIVSTLLPGRFQTMANGQQVFYIETMSRDRQQVHNVFIAQRSKHTAQEAGGEWSIFSAQSGHQYTDKNTGDQFVVATQGYRYQGTPGQKDYRIAQFGKYGVRIPKPSLASNDLQKTKPTISLWQNRQDSAAVQAELQWRLALPISSILLALLAVPLSRVKPRQGKYAQLLPSILIYIVYANMLFVSRSWVADNVIPATLGIWTIHAALLLMTLFLWLNQTHWRILRNRLGVQRFWSAS